MRPIAQTQQASSRAVAQLATEGRLPRVVGARGEIGLDGLARQRRRERREPGEKRLGGDEDEQAREQRAHARGRPAPARAAPTRQGGASHR